jgi:hypothetical protein
MRNRTRKAAIRKYEHHHYTDRTSAPVHSNSPTHEPTVDYDRGEWKINTNSQLRNGGISSYYRSRERGYGA